MIKKFMQWVRSFRYYVIADPTDNSVTLSKRLFEHIRKNAGESDKAQVFVFRITGSDRFGFAVNPDIEQPTQLCEIQYNGKYKCIGFESLCPSVGRIFYEYGLPYAGRVKLSVALASSKDGSQKYYELLKPYGKHIG